MLKIAIFKIWNLSGHICQFTLPYLDPLLAPTFRKIDIIKSKF